ncbi:hypothetical protein D3C80_1755680 [compost metagenome]
MLDQFAQGVAQADQLGDLALERGDMFQRQRLHIGTGALAILPQLQQPADFLQGETQVAGALDEGQAMQILLGVAAIAVVAAPGRLQQADAFVVADHLGAEAGLAGGLADVHGGLSAGSG